MKHLINIGLAFFIFSMANCQSSQEFEKVPDSKIDQKKLEFATRLADRIISAQKAGVFYKLSEDEAETKMISALTETVQQQAYEQVKSAFGDYQSLAFDHLMKPTDGTPYEIYRFKGQFEFSNTEVEIRVVLGSEGKLAGFFIKPWKKSL